MYFAGQHWPDGEQPRKEGDNSKNHGGHILPPNARIYERLKSGEIK